MSLNVLENQGIQRYFAQFFCSQKNIVSRPIVNTEIFVVFKIDSCVEISSGNVIFHEREFPTISFEIRNVRVYERVTLLIIFLPLKN